MACAGIVYGAVLAFAQNDVKRLVAYTSISHMGFVLLGIYVGTAQSLQGVIITMLAHGISSGALFILCGEMYERLHTRDLREMGGLWSRFPFLPPIAMFFAAASLGRCRGLANFVGEFLILFGSFKVAPLQTIVAAGGLILAASYSLIFVQRAFHGPTKEGEPPLADLNLRELATMLTLMGLLVLPRACTRSRCPRHCRRRPMHAVQQIYHARHADRNQCRRSDRERAMNWR